MREHIKGKALGYYMYPKHSVISNLLEVDIKAGTNNRIID